MKWDEIVKEVMEGIFHNDKLLVLVGVLLICSMAVDLPEGAPQAVTTILNSAQSGLFGFVTGTYVGKLMK